MCCPPSTISPGSTLSHFWHDISWWKGLCTLCGLMKNKARVFSRSKYGQMLPLHHFTYYQYSTSQPEHDHWNLCGCNPYCILRSTQSRPGSWSTPQLDLDLWGWSGPVFCWTWTRPGSVWVEGGSQLVACHGTTIDNVNAQSMAQCAVPSGVVFIDCASHCPQHQWNQEPYSTQIRLRHDHDGTCGAASFFHKCLWFLHQLENQYKALAWTHAWGQPISSFVATHSVELLQVQLVPIASHPNLLRIIIQLWRGLAPFILHTHQQLSKVRAADSYCNTIISTIFRHLQRCLQLMVIMIVCSWIL